MDNPNQMMKNMCNVDKVVEEEEKDKEVEEDENDELVEP